MSGDSTMSLPCYTGPDSPPKMHAFTGFHVGSFFIHHTAPDFSRAPRMRDGWTVTHAATGYAVHRRLKNKQRATWLAKQLESVCDWGFTDPKAVKSIPRDALVAIKILRADAMHGDCQGSTP